MVKNFIKIFIIIFIALIQIFIMPSFAIFGNWPNLILVLAVILLFFNADPEAVLAACAGGLVLDLASPAPFGLFTILLVIITLLVKLLMSRFFNEPSLLIITLIMICVLFTFDAILSLVNHNFSFTVIGFNILYSLIIAVIFYRLLSIWFDRNQGIKIKLR